MLKLCRCSLAHFILGVDVNTAKRNVVQELFVPVFSSLLDALLFRAQVCLFYLYVGSLYVYGYSLPNGLTLLYIWLNLILVLFYINLFSIKLHIYLICHNQVINWSWLSYEFSLWFVIILHVLHFLLTKLAIVYQKRKKTSNCTLSFFFVYLIVEQRLCKSTCLLMPWHSAHS
jgi:hypothetical protein